MGKETDYVRFAAGTEDVKRLKSIIDREWGVLNGPRTDRRSTDRWQDESREPN